MADPTTEPLAEDDDGNGFNEANLFRVGHHTQAEELALHSRLVSNGIEDAAVDEDEEKKEEEEEKKADQERFDDELQDMMDSLEEYVSKIIADNSPYRDMMDPNSKYYYCFEAATPEEKEQLGEANTAATQAEQAVDISAQSATDGKPSVDTVLDARIAKEDAALAGNAIVQKHGTPADVAKAAKDEKTLREARVYDRETRRLVQLAGTKEEGFAILKQRSPAVAAEIEKKAAAEMQRRNGVQPVQDVTASTVIASPKSVEPSSSQPVTNALPIADPPVAVTIPPASAQAVTGGLTTTVAEFNAAASQAPPAPNPAQDAGKFFNDNRALLDVSASDNLDDPSSKYSNSLWYAVDKKPDLINSYDDAVDKQQAACDTLEKTPTADNFLAYRQAIVDRKLAVNDIISADYSANGKTADLSQAQGDRAKLLDEQKKLGDLKTLMEGKSDVEKAELLKAAFPPDPKTGGTLGMYDKYLADKKGDLSSKTASNETDPDSCGDEDNFEDWAQGWYDDGTSCVIGKPPGDGIKDPGLNLSQTFLASADPAASPASTDPKTQVAPLVTSKPPSVLA